MATRSPSAPSFSASSNHLLFLQPLSIRVGPKFPSRVLDRPAITCRLNPSSDGELVYELHYSHRRRVGSFPVYVTLPADAVGPTAQTMRRKKAMAQSFRALAAAGVEGVVMEVWWGLVEREFPRIYDWRGYLEIVLLAKRFGLKVRAMMAFHQCGSDPADPSWIPLPRWVLEEMDKDPDVAYVDRFGRRNMEYISLGCDILPILHGRSPIQAYADLMRNFRETFRSFFGGVITGIQVGLGPGGELRYPSRPSQKLTWAWRPRELGEFQFYDKYMLASLNACAHEIGMREWEGRGPIGATDLMQNPENKEFFRDDGAWKTPYGEFFLQWYSEMLLQHGERICREAETIFRGNEVNMSGKVAGIHWHYGTQSHSSELTSGYYNTSIRDGFLPIARMFGRYGFSLCCPCFDMRDAEEQQINPVSKPESFLKQLMLAARVCDVPLGGENSSRNLDDESFKQVLKMSKLYSDGLETPSFSFNLVRMDKSLFEYGNWVSFTSFVRQMSDVKMSQAGLDFGGGETTLSSPSAFFAGAILAS
ncbi:beta-amylase 1, chloroplastic-like isoform X1 [Primulina huaijiensis]|uniref:beta-amylase 1, chloroplastic-like isoform X1 n=2 Tax=Primulina huaijiensis TaxID=1492673 RepID=UPI003CC75B08